MKAIVVSHHGDPSVLELKQDVTLPTAGPGQVVVALKAVGVNPVETYIRGGLLGPMVPYTPGSDAAGIVHEVGQGVTQFQKGVRVYLAGSISGTYAEYALAKEAHLYHLPERVSFSQGAALHVPYATAYRALFHKAHAKPGHSVLIHGASGGVGIGAVQIARAYGLTVIGTASTPEGRDLILRQGAHYAFDHKEEGYLQKIVEVTKGVDIILEMLANVNLQKDLAIAIKPGGTIVVIGSRGEITITPHVLMNKEVKVKGVSLFAASPEQVRESHLAIVAGLERGFLNPVVAKEYSLAEAPQSHQDIIHGNHLGKLVLLP